MIARIWQGRVPASKADAYVELMRDIALRDYRATKGNLGAWCLHRSDGDEIVVIMLTFWTDLDAVRAFAGEDIRLARYYDFDPAYLVDMPQTVDHYSMVGVLMRASAG